MKQEEIQQALRFVAMGRVNHPQVEQLADALAGLFARDVLPVVEMGGPVPFPFETPTEIALVAGEPAPEYSHSAAAEAVQAEPKRRGRPPKKAD